MSSIRVSGNTSGYYDLTVPDVAGQNTIPLNQVVTTDSNGNLGIGTSPQSHYTGYTAIDIGHSSSVFGNTTSSDTNVVMIANNGYLNSDASAWTYINTDEATRYEQSNGKHRWFHTASGTAGNTITWINSVTIDANGRLGIGTTNPSDALHIASGGIVLPGAISTDAQINFYNAGGTDINLQTFPLSNQTLRLKGRTDKIFYHSDRGNPDFGEVFGIDTYGRITMPYQPAFSATSSNHNVNGVIVFNQASINTGNHYNTSNGYFTAPVAGNYFFSTYGMSLSGVTTNLRTRFLVNGATFSAGEHTGGVGYQGGSSYNQVHMSTILPLSANDTVAVEWQSGYANMHEFHNKFSGFLIG